MRPAAAYSTAGSPSGISFSLLGVVPDIGMDGPFFIELGLSANEGLEPIFGLDAGDLNIVDNAQFCPRYYSRLFLAFWSALY